MAIRNKYFYAERILLDVYPVRGRDEKIDTREVILVMDSVCNALAKEGLLETWKLGGTNSVEDQFQTTFEWLTITDTANQPSSVTIPANYVTVPNNQGISRVYFKNNEPNKKRYYDPVIITNIRDIENYRNTFGNDLEGRLSCASKNGVLIFNQSGVGAKYGSLGIQLLVRSSSDIDDTSVYPIPADYEAEFILRCVNWFKTRRGTPVDVLKDNNDKP
jgi:hypothetical protein